jgi:hypothetical protein
MLSPSEARELLCTGSLPVDVDNLCSLLNSGDHYDDVTRVARFASAIERCLNLQVLNRSTVRITWSTCLGYSREGLETLDLNVDQIESLARAIPPTSPLAAELGRSLTRIGFQSPSKGLLIRRALTRIGSRVPWVLAVVATLTVGVAMRNGFNRQANLDSVIHARIQERLQTLGRPENDRNKLATMSRLCVLGARGAGLDDEECRTIGLYFVTDRTMPEATLFRAEAIVLHSQWFRQQKRGSAHSRNWIHGTAWPESFIAPEGCENERVGDGKACDEFPNASFVAGGQASSPRVGLRYLSGRENSADGGHIGTLFRCLETNEDFLVLPLLDTFADTPGHRALRVRSAGLSTIMHMTSPPSSFTVCPI